MNYSNVFPAIFLRRPNRFLAVCKKDGIETVVHVKNTGRCRELLIPGARVYLTQPCSSHRKTKYDLICVEKGARLINLDSQAPNRAAQELFHRLWPDCEILPEQQYRDSRFDFLLLTKEGPRFVEVKGVTLENNGAAYFPDAPTLRGVKHLKGLCEAVREGYRATMLFLIQMQGVQFFAPNERTHPEFGEALRTASFSGVEILAWDCSVTPDSLSPCSPVPIILNPIVDEISYI